MRAALSLYARVGRHGASVTAICAEAGLTTRYFYESFPSHDALFLVVFRAICEHLLDDVMRAGDDGEDPLAAFCDALRRQAGLARLFFAEAEQQDEGVRRTAQDFAAALSALLVPGVDDRLAAAGALGAIMRVARAWIEGGYVEPQEKVVATVRGFIRAAG